MRRLILASTSPRRKQLLEQIGLEFEVIPSDYEEDMTLQLAPEELVKLLARGKAIEIADKYPDAIVIGADSIVAFEGSVFGKPKTETEAREMLRELSGKMNQVITGTAVLCRETSQEFVVASPSNVHLVHMSEQDIDEYIATGEPMDKAGAFAVQGKGAKYIERIEGDYTAVVGLPLPLLWQILKQIV